ncbi:hypothetical protein O1L55_37400 [Streptomyces albulus]|nr:hypothetical protein [Streptomyces noursei]
MAAGRRRPLDTADCYARFTALGFGYGPVFQGLRAAWRAGDVVYAEWPCPMPPGTPRPTSVCTPHSWTQPCTPPSSPTTETRATGTPVLLGGRHPPRHGRHRTARPADPDGRRRAVRGPRRRRHHRPARRRHRQPRVPPRVRRPVDRRHGPRPGRPVHPGLDAGGRGRRRPGDARRPRHSDALRAPAAVALIGTGDAGLATDLTAAGIRTTTHPDLAALAADDTQVPSTVLVPSPQPQSRPEASPRRKPPPVPQREPEPLPGRGRPRPDRRRSRPRPGMARTRTLRRLPPGVRHDRRGGRR